ncbi:uncharacterized protein LOC124446303 [Xenia sp. Carnegie-2017]|uniref:uncharacterized protein LOC124446303 n=1 Tax=Xenia sp. Carnegie-2017 TaxID=2897299 RepID=UPI001F0464A1|nr:uncharacterized protein LOC124446303 [Xenia sp. Carnegie-2017]
MSDLKVLDGGQYSCIFDSKKTIFLGYLIVQPARKYKFTIYPEDVTSRVTEGSNFEFRCEYGKGSTKIKWSRRRRLNGTEVEDYVPENLITVRTTPQKSVEVYRIPRVSINDAGVYRCKVDGKNNRKILSATRILEVIERRAAKFKSVKKSFNFNETKKAEITLFVEEFPFPNITCYKDGKEIIFCIGKKMKNIPKIDSLACEQDQYGLNGVPQLIIQSISFVRDDGNYKCVATTNNPPGRDVVSFYVNVGGTNECLLNNGGCNQLCNNTKEGFSCSCHPGYQLDPTNSSRCIDINECLVENGGCSQLCNNTMGGYECHCRVMYELDLDGKTCKHFRFPSTIKIIEELLAEVKALQRWFSQLTLKNDECLYKGKTYKNRDNWDDGECRRCYCQNGQVLCFQEKACFQECKVKNESTTDLQKIRMAAKRRNAI